MPHFFPAPPVTSWVSHLHKTLSKNRQLSSHLQQQHNTLTESTRTRNNDNQRHCPLLKDDRAREAVKPALQRRPFSRHPFSRHLNAPQPDYYNTTWSNVKNNKCRNTFAAGRVTLTTKVRTTSRTATQNQNRKANTETFASVSAEGAATKRTSSAAAGTTAPTAVAKPSNHTTPIQQSTIGAS